MRRAFVAIVQRPGREAPWDRVSELSAVLDNDPAWICAGSSPGVVAWTSSAAPLPCHILAGDRGLVLGDLYDMPGVARPGRPADAESSPVATGRELLAQHWGQYVAILGDRGVKAVLRDPSGMIDALTWSLGDGVYVVASDAWRLPAALRPRRPFLNWDRIAAFVTFPTANTTEPLFDDIAAVGPGELLELGSSPRRDVLWSPLAFARGATIEARDAAPQLLARTLLCTGALVGDHDRVLMELSGGLDSSALAGVMGELGLTTHVAEWLNISDPRPEGDETVYARAVTDRLGVRLTTIARTPGRIGADDFAELGPEPWPAIAGVDAVRDRDTVARLALHNATGIVSGQGGDATFFQMGSALVVADALAEQGWRALAGPLLPDIARRTHQSVWGVLGQVRAARRGRLPERKIVNRLVRRDIRAWAGDMEHAWTAAALASDLPMGKRLHVRALAASHFNHQYSRRRRHADLLYPLLAQPVVELALRIPTYTLAGATYDRPYQRALFAGHIPQMVQDRRAKAILSVYFAKLMANSLDAIRPYLLEGNLCRAGVLDRELLETVLTPEHLIWKDTANDLITTLATEAWVRYWQTRAPDSPAAGRH